MRVIIIYVYYVVLASTSGGLKVWVADWSPASDLPVVLS